MVSNLKSFFSDKVNYSLENSPDNTSGDLFIGLSSLPLLADHGFQDMIVLPGAFYIDMALTIYKDTYSQLPVSISEIKFDALIILSEQDTLIEFNSEGKFNDKIFYQFGEKSADSKKFSSLYMENDKTKNSAENISIFLAEEIINNSEKRILSDDFYSNLKSNGNQYGPVFRNIKEIWVKEDEALCSFDFSGLKNIPHSFLLNPFKLDSFTQMLSVLNDNQGKTFILTKIDEIKIFDPNLPDNIRCLGKVTQRSPDKNGFTGDLTVFDSSTGSIYLKICGVQLTYLRDSNILSDKIQEKQGNLCISATFTSEPVEKSLLFWSNYFNRNYKIDFAPYNQVFQELLDSNSSFHLNKDGINVILLGLEDWANPGTSITPQADSREVERLLQGKNKYALPNKLVIAHLNQYETDYVYKEIFEDKVYLKHGISLKDGDTVIDIGANIGLFTLFVNQLIKNAEIYSFEPSPVVYELLKINSTIYGANIKTFNVGVSDKKKTARFNFYNRSSVFSGFNADEVEDKKAIQAVVRNMLNAISITNPGDLEEYVEELTNGRLESQIYDCPLISVSDIISDNHIEKIDLLKIDAEKSELEILKGINDPDWDKIRQIVIEIHDKTGQIFDEAKSILASRGFQFEVEEEKLLHQSGLYNIYAKKQINLDEGAYKLKREILAENLENFNRAFHSFVNKSQVPTILGVCERSPEVRSDAGLMEIFNEMEGKLFEDLSDIPSVIFLKSETITQQYPVKDYFDQHGYELGHIPYTQEYFTALGTSIFRRIFSLSNSTYKVIALDCDNTLWKGVCGEDGLTGIRISEPYKFLQQFMIDQIEAGMLICLCSKNNEADVLEIFDKREDMILKRDNLISWKINWNLKSENLQALAKELNLGLDSFIFIDDNPVECGEVKINCPEVLTLQLPENESEIMNFLNNIWSFDHIKLTEEDKKRTKMYKENLEREKYRESGMSLQDFLIGLNLNIKISPPTEEQISRVSQLTFRTNQFNFTTIRRTESEVNNLLSKDNSFCLIAEVSDRFGDYGLVGVLFYTFAENSLKVDTFLLSCRVLGRGVEHRILSELGKVAEKNNLEKIEIKFVPSSKNRPALDFIKKVGSDFKSEAQDCFLYTIPKEHLMNLRYEPSSENLYLDSEKSKIPRQDDKVNEIYSDRLSEKIQEIANHYTSLTEIYEKVETFNNILPENEPPVFSQPLTGFEEKIFNIWQKVLGKNNFGLNDNFFEIGGTSLKAVQLIAAIKKELKTTISIVTLFECPTIKLLSKKLNQASQATEPDLNFDEQVERGNKRRQQSITRKRK